MTTKKPYRNKGNVKTTTLKSQTIYLDNFFFRTKSHSHFFSLLCIVVVISRRHAIQIGNYPSQCIRKFKYIHGFMWAVKHPSFRNEIDLLLPSTKYFYRNTTSTRRKNRHHHSNRTAEQKIIIFHLIKLYRICHTEQRERKKKILYCISKQQKTHFSTHFLRQPK